MPSHKTQFTAPKSDNARLARLCGVLDENLRQIEQAYNATIVRRGSRFNISASSASRAAEVKEALAHFYDMARRDLSIDDIQLGIVSLQAGFIKKSKGDLTTDEQRHDARVLLHAARAVVDADESRLPSHALAQHLPTLDDAGPVLQTRRPDLQARTPRQKTYLENILSHDITFGVGPAGTGKTYLAVACAVDALERDTVKRIVLTRPAVEAGERLGFLPGDLTQKVDPYLRPLYDALYDLMGFDKVQKLFEKQMIEIAPLAYMRGRTLNHAFIILDEAQNTTPEQMKMFLTRIGFGARAVVTGDPSQLDLPRGMKSGLADAVQTLQKVKGIAFSEFTSADVVRHPLVARIVDAYEAKAKAAAKEQARLEKLAQLERDVKKQGE
ncbi:PhoH family protein [Hydromonas duriensis]|uniref:PhoH-like protein n=1 Tax=Hydromonas duriensis TaxID=1527608 RepID=A0A4R6Y6M7_9BURK|nr:PhoH family protein [Hydromonas duriensis]TDR30761.1 phosphate starvation-inducible protein PhoH [Hydromonas duriensis]